MVSAGPWQHNRPAQVLVTAGDPADHHPGGTAGSHQSHPQRTHPHDRRDAIEFVRSADKAWPLNPPAPTASREERATAGPQARPTGAGERTTTLAALLMHPHSRSKTESRRKPGAPTPVFKTPAAANALRAALREDPDPGGGDALETIQLAVAAETGHLVFGTAHQLRRPDRGPHGRRLPTGTT